MLITGKRSIRIPGTSSTGEPSEFSRKAVCGWVGNVTTTHMMRPIASAKLVIIKMRAYLSESERDNNAEGESDFDGMGASDPNSASLR